MEYRAYEAVEPLPAFDSYLTAEDRNHLAFLAPEKVEEWTRAKIDELLNRVRSLYSVSNAAAFINRKLPPEVLMEVFSHLKPSFERPGQLNILHVCRMWRHLLLRSTAFWVRVVGEFRDPTQIRPDGVDLFRTILQRTRKFPLTVALDFANFQVAKTLVPHASRIVSLTITVSREGLDFVNGYLEREGMPLLERLDISHSNRGTSSSRHSLRLNRALFPRLRSLRHPIKTLDVASIDGQLLQLALVGCRCKLCFTMFRDRPEDQVIPSLTGMLERSTSLQTLELDRITESLILRTTDDRTIFLPSLRLLRIYHNHASMLLTSLIIPNSCTVKLSNPYPDRNGSIRDLLPHDLSAFHQIAAAERVCARVVAHSPRQSLQIFEAYTDGVKRFSLHFAAMDSGRYIPAEFRLLLHSMPCVRAIEFQEDARSMAVALGNVTSGRCVCPQLDELDVQWLYWYDTGFKALKTDNEELPPILPEHNSTFRKWIQSARAHGPTVLATFCDYIRRMLLNRAAAGSHLKKLHVRIDRQAVLDVYVDKESWEPSVLRERMLARLGSDFEGDLMVSFDEDM
ncbi:hypothetical protein L227DRAFT_654282 [Lentinus tigrinus ALCF2SS1-6]|uniref:F-box domain-containing protein n=1 Tax=Lentinus tigrinus ALCF2SS1-6 TaxID=1328759 RepID=A0A5C2S6J5_9APHY|nr:hypothetical protein L227DRAFT_654282 [Lentinus tigrinus ALCF2SS1-6]